MFLIKDGNKKLKFKIRTLNFKMQKIPGYFKFKN